MLLRRLLPLLASYHVVHGEPYTLTLGDPAAYTHAPAGITALSGTSFGVDFPPGSNAQTPDKGINIMLSRDLKNELTSAVKQHCQNPFDEACTKAVGEVARTASADRLNRRFLFTAGAVGAGLEIGAALATGVGVGVLVFLVLVPLLSIPFLEGNDVIQVPQDHVNNFAGAVGQPTVVVVGPQSSVLGTITSAAMAAATTMPAPVAQVVKTAEPGFEVGDLKITLPIDLARHLDDFSGQLEICPANNAKVKRADFMDCVTDNLEAAGIQMATFLEPLLGLQGEVPPVRALVPVLDHIPEYADTLAPALGVAAANVQNPLRAIAVLQNQRRLVGSLLVPAAGAIIIQETVVIVRIAADRIVQAVQSLTRTASELPSSCTRQTYVPRTARLTLPPLNLPTGFPGPVIPAGTKPTGPFEENKPLCGAFGNQLRLERGTAINIADKFCDASAGINALLDPKAKEGSGQSKRRQQGFPNPDKRDRGDPTVVVVVAGFVDQPGCENAPVFDMHKRVDECKDILHQIIDDCDTDSHGLRNWKAGGGWFRDCILWEFFADEPLDRDEP